MQVNSIGCNTPKRTFYNNQHGVEVRSDNQQVNFTANNNDKNNSKLMRNAIMALCFLPVAGSVVTSCDKEVFAYAHADAEANAEANADANASIIDTTGYCHPGDTIIKWYYKFQRPIPLDSLFNNMQNWDIDSTDVNKNDTTAKRNIIHYEGTRDWEYAKREIGDINLLESSKNILVYDTEILDYKGNHESYGKRVLRIPSGNFTITTKDGRTLHNPGGLFEETYINETDDKNGSILDCQLESRAFVQTNGDTLRVAKRAGTAQYKEVGTASKGYLGKNTILLKNLIGEYPTDDHYVDFEISAVNDKDLRLMYVKKMDETEE